MFARTVLANCGWWALGGLLMIAPEARAGDRDEVARLGLANTAAIQSIQALKCRVTIDASPPPALWGITGGQYWRSGDRIRLRWNEYGSFQDATIQHGVVRILTQQDIGNDANMRKVREVQESLTEGHYFWHGSIERDEGHSLSYFDPWNLALCSLNEANAPGSVSFDRFVQNHAKELRSVRRVKENGVETVAVSFAVPTDTFTIYLDPAANYMIRKIQGDPKTKPSYFSLVEVGRFREAAPGVYFPEQVTTIRRQGGQPEQRETIAFHDVVINQPIPASTFDLKFRHGIYVINRIEGKKYRVNADGQPIGPKTEQIIGTSPPVDPKAPDEPLTETREEPRRWGWWILPTAGCVLCAAGVVWLVRWKRQEQG